jgi:YbbR domain-containing protein
MLEFLQRLAKNFPLLLTAMILAIAVWAFAVTANDPLIERAWASPVPIEIIGQDSALVITEPVPANVAVVLRAPTSLWTEFQSVTDQPITAVIDLSGLGSGTHTVNIQIQVGVHPVQVVSYTPETVTMALEPLASRVFPVTLVLQGNITVGYETGQDMMDTTEVTVHGPQSQVARVAEVQAILDISLATEEIHQETTLQAVDSEGALIPNVTITPDTVLVTQPITQRSGYRNVAVNLVVIGRPANGYRLANVSVSPAVVTVFSSDPAVVANLPGYVNTLTWDLTGMSAYTEIELSLNLPGGVTVIGDSTVQVQIGITALEGSVTLPNVLVELTGLGDGLTAHIAPDRADVILSGPLPLLDGLTSASIRVILDLADLPAGTYTLEPVVAPIQNVTVVSILPGSLEVIISAGNAPTVTPTFRP